MVVKLDATNHYVWADPVRIHQVFWNLITDGQAAASRDLRVLIVDDHADTRRILSRLLSKCGHEVATVDSAQAALKLLESNPFDAIISDIGLPDSSGYELVREAKKRQPLKASRSVDLAREDLRRSIQAGLIHVTKPLNFQIAISPTKGFVMKDCG
jgi:CheY-like chemotaxis protein